MARKNTLLNLVQTFLTEYPTDCVAITQDGDGGVYYWRKIPKFDDDSDQWAYGNSAQTADALCEVVYYPTKPGTTDAFEHEATFDYDTAIITREVFEEAVKKPKGDLREWRDRIIEIRALQESLKDELTNLVSSIKAEGFDINVNTLPRR